MYCPYMYIFTYVQTTGAADAGSPPKKSLGDDSLGFELPTPSPQQQQDMLKSGLSTFGYDCNFVDPPPKRLECPICLLTLRMPHVTSCCGNHFCQPCIDPLCKPSPPNSQSVCVSQRPCPICQEPRFSVMLHKGLMREVNELKVFCANRNLGCGWSAELGSLRKHLDPSSAVFLVARADRLEGVSMRSFPVPLGAAAHPTSSAVVPRRGAVSATAGHLQLLWKVQIVSL